MKLLSNIYLVGGFAQGLVNTSDYANCNVYIVAGEGGLIMVDTGTSEESLSQIYSNMKYWGLEPEKINYVLITHCHMDHCGAAYKLRKQGAKIIAHQKAAEAIESGSTEILYEYFHRRFIPCKVDKKLGDREVFNLNGIDFESIHVPGHSKGCVIYKTTVDNKKVLFTGDFIRKDESGVLISEEVTGFDRKVYIQSLESLSGISADVLLPGHNCLCMSNGAHYLKEGLVKALEKKSC